MKLAATGPPLLAVRSPAGYLHRMLHTSWIDSQRRAAVAERAANHETVGRYATTTAGDAIDVMRALDSLPMEQREAIVLHVLDGFSFREIGRMTGVSLFTAAARYRLGLRKMRGALQVFGEQINEQL